MKIVTNDNFITLIADENMMLHREYTLTDKVDLGCNDRPENWKEITWEEAMILQEEFDKSDIPEDFIVLYNINYNKGECK